MKKRVIVYNFDFAIKPFHGQRACCEFQVHEVGFGAETDSFFTLHRSFTVGYSRGDGICGQEVQV